MQHSARLLQGCNVLSRSVVQPYRGSALIAVEWLSDCSHLFTLNYRSAAFNFWGVWSLLWNQIMVKWWINFFFFYTILYQQSDSFFQVSLKLSARPCPCQPLAPRRSSRAMVPMWAQSFPCSAQPNINWLEVSWCAWWTPTAPTGWERPTVNVSET